MQNVALLYYTIKKIQRFEDREIWRVYGRFSRAITPFFSPGKKLTKKGSKMEPKWIGPYALCCS